MIALRVAKAGYYGGDIEKVLSARADHVSSIMEYENFLLDYDAAMYEINKQ